MTDVTSVRTQGLLTHLSVLLLKQVTKLSLNLTTSLAVEHGVSIIEVRLLTILDVGVIILKWKQGKLSVVM